MFQSAEIQKQNKRTVDFPGHFDSHFSQAQLVDLALKIPHEALKHVYPIRMCLWMIEELENFLS
jgi:hypothetical protein